MTKLRRIGAIAVLLVLTAGGAQAAPAYCSSAGGAAPLGVGDVTFNLVASNDCYGPVDLANQDPGTIEAFANTTGLWTPDPWTFIARDDSTTGNSGPGSYGGYTFTIAAANGTNGNPTPAAWTLTVAGMPTPFTMDFSVYLHAGNNGAYYFFDDRDVSLSNSGTFSIAFTNNGGPFPGLSGLSILGRNIRNDVGCTVNCNQIPEPGSMALVAMALLGLGWASRRRFTP
jgi:hypothetical protein